MPSITEISERFGTTHSVYPSASNVLAVYTRATPLQVERGANWYRNEHDFARALADTHWSAHSPRNLSTACGILAALSPMVPWEYAKQLALRGYRERGFTGGQFAANVDKANRIFRGEAPLAVLGGPKVRAFYHSLLTAGDDASVVTIDRHALHAAVGAVLDQRQRGSLLRKSIRVDGYEIAAAAYRRVAATVNEAEGLELTGCQIQAIVWVTWRDWLLGEGTDVEETPQ